MRIATFKQYMDMMLEITFVKEKESNDNINESYSINDVVLVDFEGGRNHPLKNTNNKFYFDSKVSNYHYLVVYSISVQDINNENTYKNLSGEWIFFLK